MISRRRCTAWAWATAWVRGPLGNGFTRVGQRLLLVGGGYGVAPLHFLARRRAPRVARSAWSSARSAADLLFRERFAALGATVVVTTDDGSVGIPGLVTSGVRHLVAHAAAPFDQLYACGPRHAAGPGRPGAQPGPTRAVELGKSDALRHRYLWHMRARRLAGVPRGAGGDPGLGATGQYVILLPTMISALVLAAGQSTRMGQLKQLLPFGPHTIIEQVATTLLASSVDEVVVVTGYEPARVAAALRPYPVRCVFNPDFAAGEMISSVQVGLRALPPEATAALLAIADQAQIEGQVIEQVLTAWRSGSSTASSSRVTRCGAATRSACRAPLAGRVDAGPTRQPA
ncbi:MAG: NTP transferase domain-containing protein [Anaerolineae bacterium]|nr:MAG: NTP transferase domain-containing protein [Anaerolineae bacterium]